MEKILIVDDENDVVNIIKDFMSERGYAVVTASNGEDGLAKFDKEKPDIVISDIKMPKKDGFQFLKEMRETRKWVPVILISGLAEHSNVLKGYEFEADYYIPKPINLESLLNAVKIMISLSSLRIKKKPA